MTLEPDDLIHISRHDQNLIQKRRREIYKKSHSVLRAPLLDESLELLKRHQKFELLRINGIHQDKD